MKKYLLFVVLMTFFVRNLQSNDLIEKTIEEHKIYNNKVWKSLIHYHNNKPSINDKSFLLSYGNFSLKNELLYTIRKFQEDPAIRCKYPARYQWVKNNIDINLSDYSTSECKELNEYKLKTNPESIDLIFVSENVKNPSSMFGHIFFKLTGKYLNKDREHSVSFYTVLNHLNLPLLFYESTLKGMKGYFILSPYKEQLQKYSNEENRNVWEYKLKLTKEQIQLLYLHFWELKDVNIAYYFTDFNCATIASEIMSIAYIKDDESTILWKTPRDVVNEVYNNELINDFKLMPSSTWKLNATKILIEKSDANDVMTTINNNHKYLEIIDTINPINTPNDSQLKIKHSSTKNTEMSLLLAGKTIHDNYKNYFGENSLKLGEINIKNNNKNTSLNSIVFYETQSYSPYFYKSKPISSNFSLGYYHRKEPLDNIQDFANIDIGFGSTIGNQEKIIVATMLNVELLFEKQIYTIFKPNIIAIKYYSNTKSILKYELNYDTFRKLNTGQIFNFTNSIYINKAIRIDTGLEKIIKQNPATNFFVAFVYYF